MTKRWLWLAALTTGACDDGDGGAIGPPYPDYQVVDAVAADAVAADANAPDAVAADASAPDAAPDAGAGCADPGERPVDVSTVGQWTIEHLDHGGWRVRAPHGAEVLHSPPRCRDGDFVPPIRVGRGEPHLQTGFGAFRIGLDTPRSRIAWEGVSAEAPRTEAAEAVTLTWALGAGEAGLRFAADGDDLRVELVLPDGVDAAELSWACGAEASYFGLGSQVTGLDLRGRTFPLWTQEQGIDKPESGFGFPLANDPEAAYAPMGVWHSSDGASAVITHDRYSEIDLCESLPDRVRLRSLGAAPGFVLVAGDTPKARLTAITARVGRPPPVPDWALAPWNDAVGGPARLRAVAETLRAEGIPSSAIWSEDWIGGEQTANGYRLSYAWAWDPETYPDLADDIAWLHARGFAFLAYFNPFVPEPTAMWAEGVAGGFLVKDADGAVATFTDPGFRPAGLVDLTNPDAREWLLGYQLTALRDLGVDGWMADFAEWLPVDAVLHSGESGWAAHNRYPLDWQRANREAQQMADVPGHPGHLFFARSGWASVNGGSAGLAPVMWAGDQNTDWDRDDGFPTVIPIGVHLGLAGVAVYGSDIAGYTSVTAPNTTKELFFRWASLGAFHPVMRTHHGSDECGNWSFDRDAETVAHYRRYARIHTLLHPYLRRLADEASATGVPMVRHPWLVAPDQPALWREARDHFFLGDDLLVAPVVAQGAAGRTVHLPSAGWWPLFGAAPANEAVIEAAADPTAIPVFVRPGTALPLLGEPVDSFYGATEPGVTDLDDVAGSRLALYPDAAGAVAGAGAAGGGWVGAADWSGATFEGAALPPCVEAPAASCALPDGARVIGPGRLEVGGAWLEVFGPPRRHQTIALAGAAWGELARATPLTDLDPDVPPPCPHE